MLRGGTTTAADMYYFEDQVAQALKEGGMRGILGETIIGFPAPDNKTSEAAFAYTERFLTRWRNNSLITAAGCATFHLYVFREAIKRFGSYGARLPCANFDAFWRRLRMRWKSADGSTAHPPCNIWRALGCWGRICWERTACGWTKADIEALAHYGVGCSYNPSSNMKSAAGLMPAPEMLARWAGAAVGIGTDGAAK